MRIIGQIDSVWKVTVSLSVARDDGHASSSSSLSSSSNTLEMLKMLNSKMGDHG